MLPSLSMRVHATPDGAFDVVVPGPSSETLRLMGGAPRFHAASLDIPVDGDEAASIRVLLSPDTVNHPVTLTVLAANGRPARNAFVHVEGPYAGFSAADASDIRVIARETREFFDEWTRLSHEVQSELLDFPDDWIRLDDSGVHEIPACLPGELRLLAYRDGEVAETDVRIGPTGGEYAVRLVEGREVRARVALAAGVEPASVRVVVESSATRWPLALPEVRGAAFVRRGITLAAATVRLEAPGCAKIERELALGAAGEVVDLGTVELSQLLTIRGHVRWTDGRPVAIGVVDVRTRGDGWRHTRIEAGSFRLELADPEPLQVSARVGHPAEGLQRLCRSTLTHRSVTEWDLVLTEPSSPGD